MIEAFERAHRDGGSIWSPVDRPSDTMKILDERSDDEIPFALDIGLGCPFVGRIDALVRHRDTNELFIMDYKSCSWLTQGWIDGFLFSPQLRGYTIAMKLLYGLDNVVGGIVETLHVLKSGPKIQTLPPFRFQEWELGDWLEWSLGCSAGIHRCYAENKWPKNLCGCNSYPSYGTAGFMCEFAQLCSVEHWESIVDLYEIQEWKSFVMAEPTPSENE